MKKFLLFCLTLIAAFSVRASVVTFDFSSQTSLTELGLTPPTSAKPYTTFPDSISYQGVTITNNSTLNQIRLENSGSMVYSFRMYSQTRVVISSATPITAIQVEWYSSAYGNNIAELTDGAWYGSSYSVTLNAYLGDNYISKITVTTEDATGTVPETGSVIQVGDFYYKIYDYGYGAYVELVQLPGNTAEFVSYSGLSGSLTIPASITYNGTDYPVTGIGYQAFAGCREITSVVVPEGVEYIDNFAFISCASLTTATLPSTVETLGNQVFGWSGLQTITIYATTPPSHRSDEYGLKDANNLLHIYVPASSVAAYQTDTVWSEHASIIEAIPEGTDPTTPVTEPLTVTWDSINGLTTIDISQYTNYNFGGEIETFNDPNFVSKEIDGITATISATVDGSYARVLTYEGNTSISVSGGGTLTFYSPELPIQSIVINFDPDQGVVNVNSASDWTVTAGDATSIQVSQVIWAGTPTYSVVLEDAYISHITSIVFTLAQEEETSSYLSVAEALTIGYQMPDDVYMTDTLSIIGYVSYVETTSADYAAYGYQTFYITDEQGSTARSNAEGAIGVYRGFPNKEVQVGDKVLVVCLLTKMVAAQDGTVTYMEILTESGATVTVLESASGEQKAKYTIYLIAPECDSVMILPAIVGAFDNWSGTPMEETSLGDRNAYVYQLGDDATGTSFKFFDAVKQWDNEILVYNRDSDWWSRLNDFTLPEIPYDTILVFDFSDRSMYMWLDCSDEYPTECSETIIVEEYWPIYEGHPVVIGDRRYAEPGVYDDTLQTVMGCDSIVRRYIERARYLVNLSSNNDDYGTVRGDTMVIWPDSVAHIQAIPYDGYVFSKWSDGNTENPRELRVTQDVAIMAIFKPFKYTITVVAEDPTMGAVMGGGTYSPNEQVTIMATPYKNCQFVQWSDGNKLNPRSFRAQEDATYTAVFLREVTPEPVICADTMYFTSADSIMMATRVYDPSDIQPYDKLIVATIDNKKIMGFQFVEDLEVRNFRAAADYTKNMNLTNVSVVEAVPNGSQFRLRVADGELAPRCEDCTSATNQLYATETGADWYFAEYDNVVVPEAVGYDQRMILYNDESMRFSSYRQLTSVDRRQTTIFKLHTPRVIPVVPEPIVEDTTAWKEEEPVDSIQVDVAPQDTVAVISTPHVDYVYSFTLIIWADEAHTQVLLVITYDADGNQLSVTRPSAVRRLPAGHAGITFEVGDLLPSTTYHYTLVACEDDGSILASLNSAFVTASTGGLGVQNVLNGQDQTIKYLHDGQLFILRNGKLYNALGGQVK